MSHTPGPWSISTDREATGVIYALLGFEWEDICVITPRCEAAANAHLIAAAPEMLDVLEELRESASYWSEYDVPLGIVERIEYAIMKARGKEWGKRV